MVEFINKKELLEQLDRLIDIDSGVNCPGAQEVPVVSLISLKVWIEKQKPFWNDYPYNAFVVKTLRGNYVSVTNSLEQAIYNITRAGSDDEELQRMPYVIYNVHPSTTINPSNGTITYPPGHPGIEVFRKGYGRGEIKSES